MLVIIYQPTQWCHIPKGHSLNIHFCTNLKSWTFTAFKTYLIYNAFTLQCHTFIVGIKQLQHASVPNRWKSINHQLKHILFSLSKGLATCFRLKQSVIRPTHKTNRRHNEMTCQHMVHEISQKDTMAVPYVYTSLHYTCYLSSTRA